MRTSFRRLFLAGFTAFFGCISLVGQGLHALVEHDFHGPAAHHHGACHAADDHVADLDAESHCAIKHVADRDSLALSAGESHDDDCPICNFFAQAQQDLVYRADGLVFTWSPIAAAAEQAQFVACVGLYRSRAPPADSPRG